MERIDRFIASPDVQGLAKSTIELYGFALEVLKQYGETAGITVLNETLVDHLPGFLFYLKRTRKVSGKTAQQYCSIIRIMMKATGCPVPGFTYRLTNAEKQDYKKKQVNRWLTEDDVKACLRYRFPRNHLRNHLIVRLLAETGCRVKEISAIQVRNVDLNLGSIFIGISKTTARHVFISPDTRAAIKRYLGSSELFEQENRKLFDITPARIKAMVGGMLKDLGIKEPGRLTHVFRHWVASHLFYDGGMRIEDIAFLLGDTVEVIEKVYLHPTQAMLGKRVKEGFGW